LRVQGAREIKKYEKENIRLQDMRFGGRYQEKKTSETGKVCLEAIEESCRPLSPGG